MPPTRKSLAFAKSYSARDICSMLGRIFGWAEEEAEAVFQIYRLSVGNTSPARWRNFTSEGRSTSTRRRRRS